MRPVKWTIDDIVLRGDSVGTGNLVVLLHAGGERRQVWRPVVDSLSASRSARYLMIDLRGHGESGGRAETVEELGADLVSILANEPGPIALVGCSLGAITAIAALTDASLCDRAGGIALVDVVPEPDPDAARRFLADQGILSDNTAIIEDVLDSGPRCRQLLAESGLPVLLVRGAESPVPTPTDGLGLSADIDVEVIAGAGHLVARDAPEALATCLLSSLDRWLAAPRLDR